MRVLEFIASEGWGGAEKSTVELSGHLAERCDLHFLAVRGADWLDRLSPRVNLHVTSRSGSRRNPLLLLDVARILRDLRPDIVHTHAEKATEIVWLLGHFMELRHVATKRNARRRRVFDRLLWRTAVSRRAAETVRGEGVLEVIPTGIDAVPVGDVRKPGRFTIVAVGRLHHYKGFDLLLDAVAGLSFDFVLEIAGEGPERQALEERIDTLGLEGRVRMLGHREDVPELLARAHLQVISSRTEGFARVAVEGLYHSDVLLSTPVGGAQEILPAELLASPEELGAAIERVHRDYRRYREIFQRVRERQARCFGTAEMTDRYLRLFERMLREGGGSRS